MKSFKDSSFFDSGALISINEVELILASNDSNAFSTVPYKSSFLKKEAYFLKPRFFLQEINHPHFYSSTVKVQNLEFKALKPKKDFKNLKESLSSLPWEAEEEEYKSKFYRSMKEIQKGTIKKAVPYMNFKSLKPKNFNSEFLPYILHAISKFQANEYLYGSWTLSEGFIGVTPEVLVSRWEESDSIVKTMALAGSAKVSDLRPMKLNSKLLKEHQYVVQDIQESLSDFNVKTGCTYEKTYHSIKHLRTDISFESKNHAETLISSLAPTSALGVYPKTQLSLMKDVLGGEKRGHYGAPFAFVNSQKFHCLVILRGLFWDENYLYIPVGGGIIKESTYEEEREELNIKFESVKFKLGLC